MDRRYPALALVLGAIISVLFSCLPTPALGGPEQAAERERLEAEAGRLQRDGKLAEAVSVVEKLLALERKALGEAHEEVAQTWQTLAWLQLNLDRLDSARQALREVLAIHTRLHGPAAWQVTDARLALADVEWLAGQGQERRREVLTLSRRVLGQEASALALRGRLDQAAALARETVKGCREVLGRQHTLTAEAVSELAWVLHRRGEHDEAGRLFRGALAVLRQNLGENHPSVAATLGHLAALEMALADHAGAQGHFEQALEVYRRTLGADSPLTSVPLHNLGVLARTLGNLDEAEKRYREVLAIDRKLGGEKSPASATTLASLALVRQQRGDLAGAEGLLLRARAILLENDREGSPAHAGILSSLAGVIRGQGDLGRAEKLLRQALDIQGRVLGPDHPDRAATLNSLALVLRLRGQEGQARQLLEQALEVRRRALGKGHPSVAGSLNNLALLDLAGGRHAEAERLLRDALEIQRGHFGVKHPEYAQALHNLAVVHLERGEPSRAEPLVAQALEVRRLALGEEHPDYAATLHSLALVYAGQKRFDEALKPAREAVRIQREHGTRLASVQAEEVQLEHVLGQRHCLDALLALSAGRPEEVPALHAEVLAWKGAVTARQRFLRLLGQAEARKDPRLKQLLEDYARDTRRLAAWTRRAAPPDRLEAHRKRVEALRAEVVRQERLLAGQSPELRLQWERRPRSPAELARLLPPGVALVDLLEYDHYTPGPREGQPGAWERRLAAFVLGAGRQLRRVDLGPAQPIHDAVEAWRKEYGWEQGDGSAGDQLRRTVWLPLAGHLAGAHTVLISPDGALTRLPFAALPGGQPGQYLIEELAVAVVPVPQLLPEMLSAQGRGGGEPSLLLVGEVDYGTPAGPERPADRPLWKPLEGTRVEMLTVRDTFEQSFPEGEVRLLRGAAATEARVRERLGGHRFLHLATHGYFSPREDPPPAGGRSPASLLGADVAAGGRHPGLMSGVVLAGANRPAEGDGDDGLLTALEVGALDLSGVELATLSACQTGLGKTAAGEGVLGLQRAFQTAGARSTIASLWSVDDRATSLLMTDLAENLLRKKLSRVEALRQAQLRMLREGRSRGFELLDRQPADARKRLPPYYWAAFVLSGDWR